MPALEEALRTDDAVQVTWRAFELRPHPVPTLDPGGEYLRQAWSGSVYPLAERLGVTMRLPPVQPRTRHAHRAAKWAAAHGRGDAFHPAVFRAFFERGEDIGSVEVLASLADVVGLDGSALRDTLAGDAFDEEVLADERLARDFGLQGVPAFVADRRAAVTGVQPASSLRRLFAYARDGADR